MVVWITPKWPLPATDGARIATTQLLSQLTRLGLKIHLCSILPEGETVDLKRAQEVLGLHSITLVRKKSLSLVGRFRAWLRRPWFPITLAPYATHEVREGVRTCVANQTPEMVVYDGLHSAGWRVCLMNGPKIDEVYRAHNVESRIWFCAARNTRNPFKKLALLFQAFSVERVERRLARESRYVFPVSFIDEKRFRDYAPTGTLQTLPIGVQTRAIADDDRSSRKRSILFVGKLDWPPNRDGLRWFLTRVWPAVLSEAPDLQLTVVGSGQAAWFEKFRSIPGVRFAGAVDDLAPYYQQSIASIVPVFYGSGTRVKAIESSLFGRACLSTELGVEGLGLLPNETYYRAETAKEWIQTLVSLDVDHAIGMGERARDYAATVFEPSRIAERFLQTTGRG